MVPRTILPSALGNLLMTPRPLPIEQWPKQPGNRVSPTWGETKQKGALQFAGALFIYIYINTEILEYRLNSKRYSQK